jgi:hypothetical protein
MSHDMIPLRLCYVNVGPDDDRTTTDTLSSRLTHNLKKLLPEGSGVYGYSYCTSGNTATADVLVGFADEDLWKKWVLKGFGKSFDESDELVDQLWKDYGTYLFSVAAMDSSWEDSGWATGIMGKYRGLKNEPQTPQHFFKLYKDLGDIRQRNYGEWYDGPGMPHEFLLEIEPRIQASTGVIFGQRFLKQEGREVGIAINA